MKTVSLVGAASYLPPRVVENDFFADDGSQAHAMFRGVRQRRHVDQEETAVDMIGHASRRLADQLNLDLSRDVDILMTNVTCPDMPFTGCGTHVAHALGCRPRWVLDMHNGGCVSFIQMLDYARLLMECHGAKTALLCNVQNAAGRIFAAEDNRGRKQARVPGDGCGVGYLVAGEESPVRSVVQRHYGQYARDMQVVRDDGANWWEASPHTCYVDFNETKIAAIMARANRIVPDAIQQACRAAGLATADIDTLITNQPNRIFLRNWREALQVPQASHVQTFAQHGNLFGAALPVCFAEAMETGKLKSDSHVVLGGFSHAGDTAAAAVVHWQAS